MKPLHRRIYPRYVKYDETRTCAASQLIMHALVVRVPKLGLGGDNLCSSSPSMSNDRMKLVCRRRWPLGGTEFRTGTRWQIINQDFLILGFVAGEHEHEAASAVPRTVHSDPESLPMQRPTNFHLLHLLSRISIRKNRMLPRSAKPRRATTGL